MKHMLHTFPFTGSFRKALGLIAILAPAFAGAQNNTNTPQQLYTTGASYAYGMPFASSDAMGQRVQVIYRPVELKTRSTNVKTPSGKITRIYFRSGSASATHTMNNVFIKLGQTTDTGYVGDNIGESPFLPCTEVFRQASYKVSTPGWIEFNLAQPFQYDNTKNLVVEFGGTNGFRSITNNASKRMIFGAVGSAKGANIAFLYDLGFDFGSGTATSVPEHAGTGSAVYPNPASGTIQVQSSAQRGSIRLHDISGRLALNTSFTPGTEISVRDLGAGLYFYTLYDEQMQPGANGKILIAR